VSAHERAAHDVDLLIDDIHRELVLVRFGEHFGPEIEECGGGDALMAGGDVALDSSKSPRAVR
jgi:hypothetical protein